MAINTVVRQSTASHRPTVSNLYNDAQRVHFQTLCGPKVPPKLCIAWQAWDMSRDTCPETFRTQVWTLRTHIFRSEVS